jgi:hypothetical protein
MTSAMVLTIAAESMDCHTAAFASAAQDRSTLTGICVGMDTSAASPDHKTFLDQVLTGIV